MNKTEIRRKARTLEVRARMAELAGAHEHAKIQREQARKLREHKTWKVKVMRDDKDELVVWGEMSEGDYRPIFYINRADASRQEFDETVAEVLIGLNGLTGQKIRI